MAQSLKYAGFQIGFFVWAWVIYWVVFALVGIVLIVVVMGFRFAPEWTLYILCYLLFPSVWTFIVFYLQALICKLLVIKKGGGKFIGIHNR